MSGKKAIDIKYIGKIDGQRIEVETNISQMNPLIASAIMMPIVKYKKKKKHERSTAITRSSPPSPEMIMLPWILPSPVSSGGAFTQFYQDMILEQHQSRLTIKVDWRDKLNYTMPLGFRKKKCAIKLDGLMSIAAIRYYEEDGIDLEPYMIAYSKEEAMEKIEWAKQFWFWDDEKPIHIFIIDYGINSPHIDPRPYENWMFSAIASTYYAHVWLPFPEDEVSDYLMERSSKLFVDGAEWISRIYQRASLIETPWAKGSTRTTIIKEMLGNNLIGNQDIILKSIRCNCGKCLECFLDMAMLTNLEIDTTEIYPYGFNNPELINKFRKMIELERLNSNMITELKNILEA